MAIGSGETTSGAMCKTWVILSGSKNEGDAQGMAGKTSSRDSDGVVYSSDCKVPVVNYY